MLAKDGGCTTMTCQLDYVVTQLSADSLQVHGMLGEAENGYCTAPGN